MAVKIKPLGSRVLVQRKNEEEQKSAGGIIIPDTAREKSTEGVVIAIGGGRRLADGTIMPLDVKVGDRVLFGKWGGTDVTADGEDYLILNEDDIYGVIA